jgi:hypothetical protein
MFRVFALSAKAKCQDLQLMEESRPRTLLSAKSGQQWVAIVDIWTDSSRLNEQRR